MSDTDDDTDVGLSGCYPIGSYNEARADRVAPAMLVGVDRKAPPDVHEGATAFRASTNREDRHMSVIDQKGWDLRNYRANPIVLFNHNHDRPIGRSTLTRVEKGEDPYLRLDVLPDSESPDGVLVGGLLARKMLSAGSVSFRPASAPVDRNKLPEDHFAHRPAREGDSPWWPALYYPKAELLEFSVVTVPSNVDAQALRAWGAAAEDPAEQLRRMIAELLPRAEARSVLLAALADSEIAERIRSIVFPPAPRPTRMADPLDYLFAPKEG